MADIYLVITFKVTIYYLLVIGRTFFYYIPNQAFIYIYFF